MSVVINTNYSATVASNNLASSNAALQKSLNRLSSGSKIVSPSDDAGGLAVSMKLSAAAHRQGAVSSNIGNATSYLQTQDGALNVAGNVLNRISELKTLYNDPTKNVSDKANYNSEFTALQAQLTALGSEKFNGVALFGTTDMTVKVTEDGAASSAVTARAVNLLGGSAGAPSGDLLTENFAGAALNAGTWTIDSGSPTVSGGVLSLTSVGPLVEIKTNASFAMPYEVNFQLQVTGAGHFSMNGEFFGTFDLDAADLTAGWNSVKIGVDASGDASVYLNGSSTSVITANNFSNTTPLHFMQVGAGTSALQNLTVSSGFISPVGPTNVGSVSSAANLGALNLSSVTSALQDVATSRAQNGAAQSRLDFANELNVTNKANLEAANSRISDVDVASESTSLARWNTLVQAGTSMLSQANQSAQIALKLLQ